MSEMIERVARALCNCREPDDVDGGPHPGGQWLDVGEPWWTGFVDQARAAIEAMREPTDGMADAGLAVADWTDWLFTDEAIDDFNRRNGVARYQAMIDEALTDK